MKMKFDDGVTRKVYLEKDEDCIYLKIDDDDGDDRGCGRYILALNSDGTYERPGGIELSCIKTNKDGQIKQRKGD